MIYDRYIMIYLYLLWFINQQTSLGGYHLVQIRKSSVTALRYWRIDQAHQAEHIKPILYPRWVQQKPTNMVILWDSIGHHGEIVGYLVKHDQPLLFFGIKPWLMK